MKRFLYIFSAAFALCCCSAEDNGPEAFFRAELETQGKLPAKDAVARIAVSSSSEWNGRLNRIEGDTRKGIRFLSGEGTGTLQVPLPDNGKEEEVEYEVVLSCPDAGVDGLAIGLVQMAGEAPEPEPGPYQPGWYELPKMNIGVSDGYRYNTEDDTQYYAWHLCTGGETGPGGGVARNYTACYSAEHHCPLWIAAPRHPMYVGSSGRNDSYRVDPDVPADIQYSSTSTGGGCNKGHMLGSAERTCSKATNRDVFYYTNIAPQLSSNFNTGGGRWNVLEDFVDGICGSVTSSRDTLYEVIGTYFDDYTDAYGASQTASTISYCGRSDVHMPTMFYYVLLCTRPSARGKAVVDCTADELQCVAFVRAHVNVRQAVSAKELMSVRDLEDLTGVSYFYNVPNAPKDSFSASDWGL